MSEKFNLNNFINKQPKVEEANEAVEKAASEFSNDQKQNKLSFDNAELMKEYYENNYPEEKDEEEHTISEEAEFDVIDKGELTEDDIPEIFDAANERDHKIVVNLMREWQNKKGQLALFKKAFMKEFGKNINNASEKAKEIHDKIEQIEKDLKELGQKLKNLLSDRDKLN